VIVQAHTTPGESPTLATGLSKAKVLAVDPVNGRCMVVPKDGINKEISRWVPSNLLTPGCMDLSDGLKTKRKRPSMSSIEGKKKRASDTCILKEHFDNLETETSELKSEFSTLEMELEWQENNNEKLKDKVKQLEEILYRKKENYKIKLNQAEDANKKKVLKLREQFNKLETDFETAVAEAVNTAQEKIQKKTDASIHKAELKIESLSKKKEQAQAQANK
jgi:hypothetical protein